MPLYVIDLKFLEPSAAQCTVESGSPDEAVSTVTAMLLDAGALNIEILACDLLATDEQHSTFKNSLN